MTITPISELEGVARAGATHLVVIKAADMTAAGATVTISPLAIPASTTRYIGVQLIQCTLKTSFTSADTSGVANALTITVGDDGSATRFLASTELLAAGTEIWNKAGANPNPALYEYTTTDTVDVFVTLAVASGSAVLSELSAGEVHLWFRINDSYAAKAM